MSANMTVDEEQADKEAFDSEFDTMGDSDAMDDLLEMQDLCPLTTSA